MINETLFDNSRLPPDLFARVQDELRDREQLLWVGQPRPSRIARAALPIVLFGIPWTAFSLFWMAGASGMLWLGGGFRGFDLFSICFPLFGIPFVLIGFGMLTAPFWLSRSAKKSFYALTDCRAIIWQANWMGSVEVRSYGPSDMTRIIRTEHSDGGGDLVFEELVTVGRDSDGHRTTNITRRGFLAIDNVREIEELVRKALLPDPDLPSRQDK